jgi:enoyl-CoA hydratase/carnithine racemase
MTEPILLRQNEGAVAVLTLNRPEALNALSDALIAALSDEFARIGADRAVRAVILRGAGKTFCAGHDLKEMQKGRAAPDKGRAYFAGLFRRCSEVMLQVTRLPQPVIAEVHGIATAAGCQLVASCDMAVAAQGTRFGVNGVNIGLFCSTPMVALTRNIPRKHAFEMLVTGEFIGASRAEALGLINRVARIETLHAETLALAQSVAAKLDPAVKIGKRLFYEQAGLPPEEAYAMAAEAMVENMMWRETDEGIRAFLEKRAPAWAEETAPG